MVNIDFSSIINLQRYYFVSEYEEWEFLFSENAFFEVANPKLIMKPLFFLAHHQILLVTRYGFFLVFPAVISKTSDFVLFFKTLQALIL